MSTPAPTYIDLFDVIGHRVDMDGYCDVPGYTRWEERVATPALQKRGWVVLRWETGNRPKGQ